MYAPLTRQGGSFIRPRGSTQVPGNMIPASRLDSVAVEEVSYLPNPNRVPNNLSNLAGNWREPADQLRNRDHHTFRFDHSYTPKWRTYLRLILKEPDDPLTGYSAGYGVADPNGLDILNRRQNWGLNNTYTFSPSFCMTSTIGFIRVSVDGKSGDCYETNYAEVFGIPGLEKGGEIFPRFNIEGGRGVPITQLGTAGNADRIAVFTNFDYEANFATIRGNHTFKFGAKYASVSRQRGQPAATLRGLEADGQL